MHAIAIHGGAGLSCPEDLGAEREKSARKALSEALRKGSDILAKGGSATEACIAAVCIMEDDPNFNAGKGSVLASDGIQRMDASIMDGNTGLAGSVCGVSSVRNPIVLAQKVMIKTPQICLFSEKNAKSASKDKIRLEIARK